MPKSRLLVKSSFLMSCLTIDHVDRVNYPYSIHYFSNDSTEQDFIEDIRRVGNETPPELIKNYKGSATYQITVNEKVDPEFISRYNNLNVTHAKSSDKVLSILTGEITDQEALSGLLNILFDHQYDIISVIKIDI